MYNGAQFNKTTIDVVTTALVGAGLTQSNSSVSFWIIVWIIVGVTFILCIATGTIACNYIPKKSKDTLEDISSMIEGDINNDTNGSAMCTDEPYVSHNQMQSKSAAV